eukprot:Platyproteum_vivax@DN4898_c0_g1_i2.p1
MQNSEIEIQLQSIERQINDLQKDVVTKKNLIKSDSPSTKNISFLQRDISVSIAEICELLDNLKVKGYNPYYTQHKRMLYAKLDTLESQVATIDKRLTQVLHDNPEYQILCNIEGQISKLSEEVDRHHKAYVHGRFSLHDYKRYGTGWQKSIRDLTEALEDVGVNENVAMKELIARKRIAYAQLEMLHSQISQTL